MAQHIPAPWQRSGQSVYAVGADGFNRMYLHVQDGKTPPEELEATAQLIQFAPNLLEVAKAVCVQFPLAGIAPVANSGNPLEALHYDAQTAVESATEQLP